MSLGRKLLSGFGAMLALVLLTSVGTLMITRDLSNDLKHAANVTARKQCLAGEVNAAASEMANCEHGTALAAMLSDKTHVVEYQKRFQERTTSLQRALRDLQGMADAGASANLKSLAQKTTQVLEEHEVLTRAMANQQMDAALSIFSQKVEPQLEEIGKAATALVEQQNRELAVVSNQSAAKSARSSAWALTLTLLAFAVGVGVFLVVRHANVALKKL